MKVKRLVSSVALLTSIITPAWGSGAYEEFNQKLSRFHKCYINKSFDCIESRKEEFKRSFESINAIFLNKKTTPKYVKDDLKLAQNYIESVFIYGAHNKFINPNYKYVENQNNIITKSAVEDAYTERPLSSYTDEEILNMDLYDDEKYIAPNLVKEDEAKEFNRIEEISHAIKNLPPVKVINVKKERINEIKKLENDIISKEVEARLKSKEAEAHFVLMQERKRNYVPPTVEFRTFDRLKRVNNEFILIKVD